MPTSVRFYRDLLGRNKGWFRRGRKTLHVANAISTCQIQMATSCRLRVINRSGTFFRYKSSRDRWTPAILQSCSVTMGVGLLRATERISREVTTGPGKQAARAIVGVLG